MSVSAAQLLRRGELEERLDAAFGKKLVLVTAGAGYGKSTLVEQWSLELESTWYAISPHDFRLSSFAVGIANALFPRIDSGDELIPAIAAGRDDLVQAEVLAAHLSTALQSLAYDLVLVLDDAHQIAGSAASRRLIEALCRQLPPQVHVVLMSRETLGLRIERLRAEGAVSELNAAELAFTPTEASDLARVLSIDDEAVAAEVYRVTGGWPVAFRLMLEALSAVNPADRADAIERLGAPGTPLFDYLALEVFEREPRDVQFLIRRAAELERFTVEQCEALGARGARETIERLVQRGLFVRRQGAVFEMHSLTREFARAALPLTEEETRAVHVSAARWLESNGRLAEALREFSAASESAEIVRILREGGDKMLRAGQANAVAEFVGNVPPALRDERVERLWGEALFMTGDFASALACYERAAGRAGVNAGLAWRLGIAYHFQGEPTKALETYERAPDGAEADNAIVLSWAASAQRMRGELGKARELSERAVQIAEQTGDDRALAAAYVAAHIVSADEGTLRRRANGLEKALEAAERCRDLVQLRRIRVNRAADMVDRGAYEAAIQEIDHVFRISDTAGLDFPEHALTNRGRALLRLGRLDEAHSDYASVIERSHTSGSLESRYGFLGVGDVHRERGNGALAGAAYQRALELAEDGKHLYALSMTLQGLARVLVDDDHQEAARLADRATLHDWAYRSWALSTAGWIAISRGAGDDAASMGAEALRLAGEQGDAWALAEALEVQAVAGDFELAVPRLHEALAIWRELGARLRVAECELAVAARSSSAEAHAARQRSERVLRSLGVRPHASGPAGLLRFVAVAPAVPLEIRVLGEFRVFRDGKPIPMAAWRSKKSRDLLKILVCQRGRAISREAAMDALWPGEDPEKLPNRLSVCLSTLRSILDPERRLPFDHFVKTDGGSVRLDLGTVLVDLEVFFQEAEAGLSLLADGDVVVGQEWLAQAESIYGGNLLDENPYDDWALFPREEALSAYLSVVHALAGRASEADEGRAARYYHRILRHDPDDEGAYLGLVATLERSGRRGEARRAYRSYVARMERLGVAPAAFPIV